MISVLFLLIAIALGVWGFKVVFDVPPIPPETKTFMASVMHGKLEATIQHQADENDIQRALSLWAIGREERVNTAAFHLALEKELQSFEGKVISIALSCPILDPPEPPKLSPAERVIREMKTAEELLVAYCKAKDSIDPSLDKHTAGTVKGRSIKTCLEDIADHQINRIVNPSGVTSPFRT